VNGREDKRVTGAAGKVEGKRKSWEIGFSALKTAIS
jgi:hypothetical protein